MRVFVEGAQFKEQRDRRGIDHLRLRYMWEVVPEEEGVEDDLVPAEEERKQANEGPVRGREPVRKFNLYYRNPAHDDGKGEWVLQAGGPYTESQLNNPPMCIADRCDPNQIPDSGETENWKWEIHDPGPGYHTTKIPKGHLGASSKILEEVLELQDAEKQGAKIMGLCEVADIYGALKAYVERNYPDITLADIQKMSELTERAFKNGRRK